jgi:hypothetical protein
MLDIVKHLGARSAGDWSTVMVWKRLFGRNEDAAPPPAPSPPEPNDRGIVRRRPRAADPATQARLDALHQRRDMAAYDLERAESAREEQNPWRERMALLDQSLATIEEDLRALDATPALPPVPLPETPITGIAVSLEEPVSIAFTIGPERFRWEEEIDWDQRGGPVVRGQMRQRAGDAASLVPPDVPEDRREALARHLAESATVSRKRRRWPIWLVPVRSAATGLTGAVTATPAPPAPTGGRRCTPKPRASPRNATTRRRTATSGPSGSWWPANAWPTWMRRLQGWKKGLRRSKPSVSRCVRSRQRSGPSR